MAALREKLLMKEFPEEEVEQALEWCLECGYLDDEAYAARVIELQQARGYGPRRAARYLESRGIDRETARQASNEAYESMDGEASAERLDALLTKINKGKAWDPKERKRCADALARRGFVWEDISAALGRFCGGGEDSDF